MACSIEFGSLMIWKAGILSPGRGRVNNTFALVAGMSESHFLAHHEPVCVAAGASRDFRDAPGIFGGNRGAAAAPP